MAPLRWGIASAGRISNDFCAALSSHPVEQHQIVAVAARSLSSAQAFAQKFNISKCYDAYEKLAADAEVGMFCCCHFHFPFLAPRSDHTQQFEQVDSILNEPSQDQLSLAQRQCAQQNTTHIKYTRNRSHNVYEREAMLIK